MSEAILLALVGALSGIVGAVLTTLTNGRKNKTDSAQAIIATLMDERKYLNAEIRTCHEEIRKLKSEFDILQDRQRQRAEQDDALDELDKQIRHDGATLVRNLLTVLTDNGIDRPDLVQRAKVLEKVRDMRREAAGQPIGAAMVPK